ncbi:hypothetical protein ACIA78_21215 [Streptomyces xanthochromogenes]|uniref:hypothetical protein n=1 Tax=Streptomyces xanthochromogenes TaxID=67384 RepID=UPI0037A24096
MGWISSPLGWEHLFAGAGVLIVPIIVLVLIFAIADGCASQLGSSRHEEENPRDAKVDITGVLFFCWLLVAYDAARSSNSSASSIIP